MRITAAEREEKKRLDKKEKKEYAEEEERNRMTYNFVKYPLGMKHQVIDLLVTFLPSSPNTNLRVTNVFVKNRRFSNKKARNIEFTVSGVGYGCRPLGDFVLLTRNRWD